MNTVLELLKTGDLCSLLILIAILCFVGWKMVEADSHLQVWGWRFAALAFLAYGVYGCVKFSPATAEDFLGIAFRGLLAAGLMLGASWMLLAIVAFGYWHSLGALSRKLPSWFSAAQKQAEARRARQREEERRQREQEEWERGAPERERYQQELEARKQAEAAAQKRRDDARAKCELLYDLYAPDLKKRFPKSRLDDFVAKYLGDNHPPEYVEERAEQLQAMLRQHHEQVRPPAVVTSMSDLTLWYQQAKEEIEALSLDDEIKNEHVAELEERYSQLTQQFLRSVKP